MGRRSKSSRRVAVDGAGFGGSFGDLLKAQGLAPAGSSAESSAPAPDSPADAPADPQPTSSDALAAGAARVRHTRKGRGGKTVTLVEGLDALDDAARSDLARRLRKALGRGARVEGAAIAVQGDARDAVADWLDAQGLGPVPRGT